jgi:isopenicillin N synthase-like dioxygenase
VLSDHPVPQAVIDEALADTTAFFALPVDEKLRYRIEGGMGQRGYVPFGVETAKGAQHHDLKEFWHVGRDLPPGHRFRDHMPDNVWPDAEVPGFRPHLVALYAALDGLGNRVLRAVARHVRAGAHEDINVITLLLGAEEAGLELLDRDGKWLAVNPPAGSIVINIGDMLQRLTNHRLPSTTHRVVNPAPERRGVARYSTPFFLHFASDYLIRTLPQTIDADHPDRYPQPITADGFLKERLREIKLA